MMTLTKRVFVAFGITLAPLMMSGPAAAASGQVSAQAADVVVAVDGLVCDFCVMALTKTFSRQPAVEGIAVDLDKGEIRIAFKPQQKLDDATLRSLITRSGYAVRGIRHKAIQDKAGS
jgi:copper chaperone CopZ